MGMRLEIIPGYTRYRQRRKSFGIPGDAGSVRSRLAGKERSADVPAQSKSPYGGNLQIHTGIEPAPHSPSSGIKIFVRLI
jgi:hypothetical protein